jgi:hypothetical protein
LRKLDTVVVIAVVLAAAGCGGGSGDTGGDVTSISASDLHQGATFWLSLEAPLRRELAGICRDKAIKEAPSEAVLTLQKLDLDDYVALMDREYEGQGEDNASDIQEACKEAQDDLLRENLEQLLPHLREGAE